MTKRLRSTSFLLRYIYACIFEGVAARDLCVLAIGYSHTLKKNLSQAQILPENRGLHKGDFGDACQKAG